MGSYNKKSSIFLFPLVTPLFIVACIIVFVVMIAGFRKCVPQTSGLVYPKNDFEILKCVGESIIKNKLAFLAILYMIIMAAIHVLQKVISNVRKR